LFLDVPSSVAVQWSLLGGCLATLALVGIEVTSSGTPHVEAAVKEMTRGAYRQKFAIGVGLGLAVPAALVVISLATGTGPWLAAIAGLAAVVGMWFYEDSFVRAGQSVPLS
ncbi:MAG: hypothetical protein AAGK32_01545, partial [Actinomycetota bacterium]